MKMRNKIIFIVILVIGVLLFFAPKVQAGAQEMKSAWNNSVRWLDIEKIKAITSGNDLRDYVQNFTLQYLGNAHAEETLEKPKEEGSDEFALSEDFLRRDMEVASTYIFKIQEKLPIKWTFITVTDTEKELNKEKQDLLKYVNAISKELQARANGKKPTGYKMDSGEFITAVSNLIGEDQDISAEDILKNYTTEQIQEKIKKAEELADQYNKNKNESNWKGTDVTKAATNLENYWRSTKRVTRRL